MGIVLHGMPYAVIVMHDLSREIWENNVLCWNRQAVPGPCNTSPR